MPTVRHEFISAQGLIRGNGCDENRHLTVANCQPAGSLVVLATTLRGVRLPISDRPPARRR